MQQRQQPFECRERRGAHVGLAQARLDRLEVPVAEVVEREVVEPVDRVREVEACEIVLELRAGRVDAGEDPALLDRRRPGRAGRRASHEQQPARVPELVRELAALFDRLLENRTSCVDDIFSSP